MYFFSLTQYTVQVYSPEQGVGQPDGTLVVITLATPVESFSENSFPFTSYVNKHNSSQNIKCLPTKYETCIKL